MIRVCKQCKKEYETPPSQRKHFCSSKCAGAAKNKKIKKNCEQCSKEFLVPPSKSASRFCSKSCARTFANLTDANPSFHRDISGSKNPMFGVRNVGEKNPMFGRRKELSPQWKGGLKRRADGYILQVADDSHPNPAETSSSGTKYVLQHRLVMERILGRYLEPHEVVHHIDENPSNNDPNNLKLYANQKEHMRFGHNS